MSAIAVLIACGKEEEIKPGVETAFLSMGTRPVLGHCLRAFEACASVDKIVLVVSKEKVDAAVQVVRRFGCTKVKGVIVGGSSRLSSLRAVCSKMELPSTVLVHEVSRPFVSESVIKDTVKAAKRYGCAIAAHRLRDSVKSAPSGLKVAKTLDRGTSWAAQTPQVFRNEVLKKIVGSKQKTPRLVDDESCLLKKPSEVHLVEAGGRNMKIRTAEDLSIATAMYQAETRE